MSHSFSHVIHTTIYLTIFLSFTPFNRYRRILFIGVIPLISIDLTIRAYAGCTMGLLFAVYFRETMPYRESSTNFLGFCDLGNYFFESCGRLGLLCLQDPCLCLLHLRVRS